MKTKYYVILLAIASVTIFPIISIVFYGAVPVGINTRLFESCSESELDACSVDDISEKSAKLSAYDESLAIRFSPLYYGEVTISFDWCTENDGFWDKDNSTCYFENKEDFEKGTVAVKQYTERIFVEKENEY